MSKMIHRVLGAGSRGGLFALLVLAMLAVGCSVPPEERVERLRAGYNAEASSITIEQEPIGGAEPEGEAEVEGEDDEGDESEGDEMAPTPVRTNVVFDILVLRTTDDGLEGLTLDVTHADADQNEKGVEKLWIDTSTIIKGASASVTAVLEDVQGYADGDMFSVEVRTPIPPEERGDYREFASTGG